jgi:hypothetical protein
VKDKFYLACFRDNVGSNVSFHCIDGKGYSTNIDKAHVYSREEAQKEWDTGREYDQPISAEHVDKLAVWKVDCQYIPTETQCINDNEMYVAYQENKWDGNDVYWLTMYWLPLTNFKRAYIMNFELAKSFLKSTESSGFVVIPYRLADEVKRRTFDFKMFKPRSMVQGAGLRMPERLKRTRRKVENPQSRFNCPHCGKIVWQYNPYEFDHCPHCGQVGAKQ